MANTQKGIQLVFGGLILLVIVGAVWNTIATSMAGINTSTSSGAIIVLAPLILAGGVLYYLVKSYM